MSFTKVVRVAVVLGGLAARPAFAATADFADLADLAARIEYGFYSNEPRVIDAARAALERSESKDSSVAYYRALAAFRLAQLDVEHGTDPGSLLEECLKPSTSDKAATPAAAEAWILVAACANLAARTAPLRSLLLQRRRDQALSRAREIEPSNPRITLVEAWSLSLRPARESPEVAQQAADELRHAIEEFGSWTSKQTDPPDWGEAEALASLGEILLARGSTRDARDLIERALLIAPDYDYAVGLRKRLRAAR